MDINYVTILAAAIVSMVVGAVWYGPLFGKKWAEIIGANLHTEEERNRMQKEALPLYLTQFVITLFQLYVLAHYIKGAEADLTGISNAIWIWAGFIMPAIAASIMWTIEPSQNKWARFFIQGGYQFVMFCIFGWMLSTWG